MKPVALKSQSALAKRLGVTQQRVSQLLGQPEWRWGRGPWSEAQAQEIAASLEGRRAGNNATAADAGMEPPAAPQSSTSDPDDDETPIQALSRNPEKLARIKLVVERTAKIKLERELLAGGYVKKEEVEQQRVSRIYSVRAKLQELPLRASLVAHKSEAECERILSDWCKEVCDYYADGGN